MLLLSIDYLKCGYSRSNWWASSTFCGGGGWPARLLLCIVLCNAWLYPIMASGTLQNTVKVKRTPKQIFLRFQNYLSLSSSKILLRADRSPLARIEQALPTAIRSISSFWGRWLCGLPRFRYSPSFSLNLAPQPFVHSQQRKDVVFFLKWKYLVKKRHEKHLSKRSYFLSCFRNM